MSDESKVSLSTVCCTCLNTDRKLQKLCRISEGVNLLYLLLSADPDAYKEIFYKDSTSLHMCWECGAIMRKIRLFQEQASRVMRELNNFCNSSRKHTKPLSNLSTYILTTNEIIIQDPTKHFIDCGTYIKTEVDPDDIPLSQLNHYENDTQEIITRRRKKQTYNTISKLIHPKNFKKGHENLSYELIDKNHVAESLNSSIRDYKEPHSPIQNYKQAHETITKPINLKTFENGHETVSEDEIESLNSPIRDYKKPHSPIENYKQAHKTKTKPINIKTFENDHENVSEDELESLNSPIRDYKKPHSPIENYKQAHETITKPINLKIFENSHENVSEDEINISEGLNSPLRDYKNDHSPIENYKQAHKTKTKPIDQKKDKRNQESSPKCFKKKIYNFSGNKKKRKKNVFREVKLKYQCPECNSCFENKNIRWKHIQKLHREGHQCSVCEKRFALKSNLQRHEKIHSAPPPRELCPTCNKSVRVDLMQAHALTHTDRQKYSCLSCSKTFVCRDTYHSHLKYSRAHCRDDVLARYKCSSCDKRYRSQAELRDHVNYQHKGQTEHKCPVCGKGLATKRCIRRHVRRAHEGIKENARDKICQRCGKAFRDKKSLREHEYIHTGERPLSCELCGQTFRQYASLYSHRKRVHKLVVPQKTVTVLNKD